MIVLKRLMIVDIHNMVFFVIDETGAKFFLDVEKLDIDQVEDSEMVEVIEKRMKMSESSFKITVSSIMCNENVLVGQNEVNLLQWIREKTNFKMISYTSCSHTAGKWVQKLFDDASNDYSKVSSDIHHVLTFFGRPEWIAEVKKSNLKFDIVSDKNPSAAHLEYASFIENYPQLRKLYSDSKKIADDRVAECLFIKNTLNDAQTQYKILCHLNDFQYCLNEKVSVAAVVDKFHELKIGDIITSQEKLELITEDFMICYMLDPNFKGKLLTSKEKGNLSIKIVPSITSKGPKLPGSVTEYSYLIYFQKSENVFGMEEMQDLIENPHDFWKSVSHLCPKLSSYARSLANLPNSIPYDMDETANEITENFFENEKLAGCDPIHYYRCLYSLKSKSKSK